MSQDWRLKILGLNAQGDLTKEAVRAAYWRHIGETRELGASEYLERLKQAKRELLFELGVRIPSVKSAANTQTTC